jgi:hypothetical protein
LGELNAITVLNIDTILQILRGAGIRISKDEIGADVIDLPSGAKLSIIDGWEKIMLELITVSSTHFIYQ